MYLYRGAKRPTTNTYKVHTAEAAAEAASKSVLAIHSIYEKLPNELPTFQVLPNELGFVSQFKILKTIGSAVLSDFAATSKRTAGDRLGGADAPAAPACCAPVPVESLCATALGTSRNRPSGEKAGGVREKITLHIIGAYFRHTGTKIRSNNGE